MQNLLSKLNPQQRQAVTAGLGQNLVLAGPGSGKTRVLTQRIAYLIHTMGVRPSNILAVTFTNKAAREMSARVEGALGQSVGGLWLGTFHAVCARLLRREAAHRLPFDANFVIMDSDDQEAIVKRAVKDLNLDEKLYRPGSIHAAISNAKNSLLLPDDFAAQTYRDEVVKRIYQRYQQMLQNSNAVDFDDLLLWAVRLLEENPAVRESYAGRFEHVLVDEFQDTNMAQYQLLGLLSSCHHNLFVVGDEDQSIYRWRGADYRNILRFEKDFPEARKILLEQNYRSTQTVLDAARAVIDRNQYRTPKHLFSERGRGDRIVVYEAADDHAEAAYVVNTIVQALGAQKGCSGGDFAIMYRTNAQSRLLEEAFLRAGLPYRLVGAQRFYGRREIKDMISFLRVVHNPADEVSVGRVINLPPRGIGDKTIIALQLAARRNNISPGEVLLDLGRAGEDSTCWKDFNGRSASLLADFGAMLVGWRAAAAGLPLPALFDRILAEVGYRAYLDDRSEEGIDRWENVEELRKLAYEYQERGLGAFLEDLALVSDQDTIREDFDAPTLLTLHAAKGLEFKQVFIVGLDEGLLPHSRSRDDPEEMAEERRLFYVGLTRARDWVYLVRANQRTTYGSYEYSEESRFLADIPDELLNKQGVRTHRYAAPSWEQFGRTQTAPRWESARASLPEVKPVPEARYRPTQRVRHPSWGEGIVLESRIQDGEETLDVEFESVGFKRLIASLAKLEVVG
ncbi:MAG: UvrD-helicase domain-containing protein [Anaerolineaceae bacterium]|nr:UvrD-helicase domain-containing protein [Anaerolineaceae bacterium]